MSFVRLAWATITAFFVVTLITCVLVVMPNLARELERSMAARSQVVAGELLQDFARLVPAAAPEAAASAAPPAASTEPAAVAAAKARLAAPDPLHAWLPQVQKRGKAEGWSQLVLIDAAGKVLTPEPNEHADWTHLVTHGWQHAGAGLALDVNGRKFGRLTVAVSTQEATDQIRHAAGSMATAFLVLGGLLMLAMKRLETWARKPLEGFSQQIQGLSERQFIEIAQPTVAEWVGLSKSLNVMVARVRHMLQERDEAMGTLKNKLAHDQLTHTASRESFMDGLKSNLRDNDQGGGVAIVRVNDLEGMNRRLGRNRTDEFLVAVATNLRSRMMIEGHSEDFILARLNGADFGLLMPSCDVATVRTRLQSLSNALAMLMDEGLTDCSQVAWIGGTTFLRGESVSDVLVRVDTMVMAAESQQDAVCVTEPSARQHVMAIAQWRVIIETALDTGHLDMVYHPVVDGQGQLLHHEGMLRLVNPGGQAMDADDFIPPAIRCGRVTDLDLKAVELALVELARPDSPHPGKIAVNIAAQSALRPIFHRQLATMLGNHPDVAQRLMLEVREPNLASDSTRMMDNLCRTVEPFGCAVGLDHFGIHLQALPVLSASKLRYVKLADRLCMGAATERRMAEFVRVLAQLGRASGVQVIAMGLQDTAQVPMLLTLGVQGFTGPAAQVGMRAAVAEAATA